MLLSSTVSQKSLASAIASGLLFVVLTGMSLASAGAEPAPAEHLHFAYQLEENKLSGANATAPRATYHVELPPGSYRFQMLAASEDGQWKEYGAGMQFEIAPTILQALWFRLLLAALAGGLLWWWCTHRSRQAAADAQSRLEERLDERHRIARELHDTLLQSVQGLILKVQAVALGLPQEKHSLRDEIQTIVNQAISSLEDGRSRVENLRIHGLQGATLEAVLNEAADQFAQEHLKEPPWVQVIGTPRPLHLIVEEELSAIGKEALINSYRHAHQVIGVELRYGRRHFTLSITDAGPGIPRAVLEAQGRAGHWGLPGMYERTAKIGGRLALASVAGNGARITVTLPARMAYQRKPWRWRPPHSPLHAQLHAPPGAARCALDNWLRRR
jgi:signal transduction histidine kinase